MQYDILNFIDDIKNNTTSKYEVTICNNDHGRNYLIEQIKRDHDILAQNNLSRTERLCSNLNFFFEIWNVGEYWTVFWNVEQAIDHIEKMTTVPDNITMKMHYFEKK